MNTDPTLFPEEKPAPETPPAAVPATLLFRFEVGARVVYRTTDGYRSDLAGRHGVIVNRSATAWRSIFGGPAVDRTEWYDVRSDAGAEIHAPGQDLEPETGDPPPFAPDPSDPLNPRKKESAASLLSRARYAEGRARELSKHAARRRVRDYAKRDLEAAAIETRHAAAYRATLSSWAATYPQAAAEVTDLLEWLNPPPPAATAAPVAGSRATVKLNQEHDGVELHFPAKPDVAALQTLKANGWRWSPRSACWYIRRSDETLAFARQMAGQG